MKLLKRLALVLLSALCFSNYSNAQITTVSSSAGMTTVNLVNGLTVTVNSSTTMPWADLKNNPAATNVTMGDDSNVEVPLQFTFPFFGQNFNTSWMHSNGVVSFQSPNITGNFCCSGWNLDQLRSPQFNYSIMALWTDLIAIQGGSHYTLGTSTTQTYGWYGVSEYYDPTKRNSFEIKIDNTGGVDVRFTGALIGGHVVTSGMVGDISKGEYYQFYHGQGFVVDGPLQWSTIGVDMCTINPLSSTTCTGYLQAYHDQQCLSNPLYASDCPGYQQAYQDQQCSINPLYSTACAGYAAAYLQQQCNSNQLYSTQCPGYSQAYAQKLALEAQKAKAEETTVTATTSTTTTTVTATSSGGLIVDNTSTTAEVKVDLGGATITATGEVKPADGIPEVTKQAQTTSAPAVQQEQEKKVVTPVNALAIARNAVAQANAIAMSTVNESIKQSTSENANPSDGIGLASNDFTGTGLKLYNTTTDATNMGTSSEVKVAVYVPPVLSVYRQEQVQVASVQFSETIFGVTQVSSYMTQTESAPTSFIFRAPTQFEETKVSSNTVGERQFMERISNSTLFEEQKTETVETVKNKGEVSELAGGVDIKTMAYIPVGYDSYQKNLPDVSFYKPEEIYKDQKNVDNARALRQLSNDSKHRELVDLQYNR